jgi:hypothetical protein
MLDRLKNLFRAPERKASRTAQVVALQSAGRARWTPRDYAALAREGYMKNAIVHRAVRLVAENVASVTWLAFEGEAERDTHPLLDLLARPNPRQDGAAFFESVTAHLLLAGNAYIEHVSPDGRLRELHALRPDRMTLVPGSDGWPEAYEYSVGGRSLRFEQNVPLPPILHLTQFHPLDDHYGLAATEPAAIAIDALVMLNVLDRDLSAPPPAPVEGARYLVAAPGAGAFTGRDNQVAHYADGGWLFHAPQAGWTCFVADESALLAFDGKDWMPAIDTLGGVSELQNLTRLGIGTAADETNPFAAKLNNALWTARTGVESGDGDLRYKLNKEAAANTLSLLMQSGFSGRAEIGLTGDDDLHVKVSPDGSTWIDTLLFDRASGAAKINAGVFLTADIAPAQITADQNDYNPAGLAGASVLRLTSDAARDITGLSGGGAGRVIALLNVGEHDLVLKHAHAGSDAGNRFALPADMTVAAGAAVLLWYDAADSRWKLLAGAQAGGGAAPGIRPNLLINGEFRIDQRAGGAATARADDTYCLDRWYVLTEAAAITVAQQSDQENGTPFSLRGTQGQVSAQRFGFAQIVEAKDCKQLRGQQVTLSGRIRCSAAQAVRYAILEWTGTADAVTSDIVNNWASGSYTAGNFFPGANLTVAATGAITPAGGSWTELTALVATLGNAVNNIIVLVWTQDAAAQNVSLDLARMKLEQGASASALVPRPMAEELALCQRYFEVISSAASPYATFSVGQCASTSRAVVFVPLLVPKRAAPAVSVSANADWAFVNANITSFVAWSSFAATASETGVIFDVTTASAGLGGAGQATLLSANGTSNARMYMNAEM